MDVGVPFEGVRDGIRANALGRVVVGCPDAAASDPQGDDEQSETRADERPHGPMSAVPRRPGQRDEQATDK